MNHPPFKRVKVSDSNSLPVLSYGFSMLVGKPAQFLFSGFTEILTFTIDLLPNQFAEQSVQKILNSIKKVPVLIKQKLVVIT